MSPERVRRESSRRTETEISEHPAREAGRVATAATVEVKDEVLDSIDEVLENTVEAADLENLWAEIDELVSEDSVQFAAQYRQRGGE